MKYILKSLLKSIYKKWITTSIHKFDNLVYMTDLLSQPEDEQQCSDQLPWDIRMSCKAGYWKTNI